MEQGVSAETVAERAALGDVDVVPLSRYCHTAKISEGLQIGFAAVHEKDIPRGVLKLARVFDRIKAERVRETGLSQLVEFGLTDRFG